MFGLGVGIGVTKSRQAVKIGGAEPSFQAMWVSGPDDADPDFEFSAVGFTRASGDKITLTIMSTNGYSDTDSVILTSNQASGVDPINFANIASLTLDGTTYTATASIDIGNAGTTIYTAAPVQKTMIDTTPAVTDPTDYIELEAGGGYIELEAGNGYIQQEAA